MPPIIETILRSRATNIFARLLVTYDFWISGIMKIVQWPEALGQMAKFGLHPPEAFNIATIIVQLLGSALIIWGPFSWLGAGMLAVFTALTIPIAIDFWNRTGPAAHTSMMSAFEHMSLIGGLMAVALLRFRDRSEARSGSPERSFI